MWSSLLGLGSTSRRLEGLAVGSRMTAASDE
jgi:hypothetical protein